MRNQFADVLVDSIERTRGGDGPWFADAVFTAVASTLKRGNQEQKCEYVGETLEQLVKISVLAWALLNLAVIVAAGAALSRASAVAKIGMHSAPAGRAYAMFAA